MPEFSIILQTPEVRAIVQENLLERAFHDALFPHMLYRAEAVPVPWPAGVGDTMVFSAPGLMPVSLRPLQPGVDPTPQSYAMEQWVAQLQTYGSTIDTHMPTSMVAIADLFLRNAHQLGLQAAQTMNRLVRDKLFNMAESGWTVFDGGQGPTSTLLVKRLNGFTRARNPTTLNASRVKYDTVSASNPLTVTINTTGGPVTRTITAYTPTNPGDEFGPGTVTIVGGNVTVADRAYMCSVDRTNITRVGGGNRTDDITSADTPTLADVRTAVATFWTDNVPEHPDGRFHCHLDPVSQSKIFGDAEFQRLMTALPDYYTYKLFALGEMLGTVFFRNSESPIPQTVAPGDGTTYSLDDPLAPELYSTGATTGAKLHRMLFTAQGAILEYFSDLGALLTEAGMVGKVADPRITNNGIEVLSDRIQLIIRAPLNRLQDMVATSWKFIGDWPMRTDGATGSVARYKRAHCIVHGE